jgi:hypothetical protein
MTTTHVFAPNPFLRNNPFLSDEDLVEEPTGEAAYAIVPTGPAVAADEVESHVDVIEVKVRWGTQVLTLRHLDGEKGFAIGEGSDFEMAARMRTSIVERRAGAAYVVIPEAATATSNGGPVTGEVMLREGARVTIELDGVTIEVASVRAGRKYPVSFMAALASGAAACIGLSFVGHAAIVASLAMFMPKMNADDAEAIDRQQILAMRALLDTSADREAERLKEETAAAQDSSGGGSAGGEPHKGEMGAAGTTKPVTTKGHMAFKGDDDRVRLSRRELIELAANEGFVGVLRAQAPLTGPSTPWSTDTQLGQDEANKHGGLFGATADDVMGYGLGLTSTGEGGGGNGLGIGIDGIGDLVGGGGNGPGKWGLGKGDKDGIGNGHGPGRGAHVTKGPQIRQLQKIDTNGHLPPEVIQRIVRQNFGRFRLCYEAGLRGNPALTGRVVTKFVIGRDGSVAQSADGGSDIASQEVIGCVVRSFGSLSFPQPEGGVATVIYPIVLSPGE